MTHEPGKRPWIVIVGGFLGAGKTSLILAAAELLKQRGLRCAAILNDQGEELVDRRHAERQGLLAREVAGGCFCCRLSSLVAAIEELRTWSPDVIFAEPVGSCTDISATVFAPLREEFDRYRLAPFTVLVDPSRAAALLASGADPDLAFLFEKQLQEADLVCLTKGDLHPQITALPGIVTRLISAKTGEGVEAWLSEILTGGHMAGRTILEIDYARYAQAEAALAWLNLSFVLESSSAITPAQAVGPFMDRLDISLADADIAVVHLKIFASSANGWIKAAICGHGQELRLEGHLDASAAIRHELLVNLRAKGNPARVRQIVQHELDQLPGEVQEARLECFSPAAPQPERRLTGVRKRKGRLSHLVSEALR
jgi:Ni2+-binding GTPase involved in maturation of urease and hydrogenase